MAFRCCFETNVVSLYRCIQCGTYGSIKQKVNRKKITVLWICLTSLTVYLIATTTIILANTAITTVTALVAFAYA